MKKILSIFGAMIMLLCLMSFKINTNISKEAVYKCTNCCKVKNGDTNNTPWESGCINSSSGMHHYVFAAHSGAKGYYCSKCKTEIYVKQDQGVSASASRCCSDEGLCSWYNK